MARKRLYIIKDMLIRNDASSHYSFGLQDRRPMTEARTILILTLNSMINIDYWHDCVYSK